MIKVLVTGKNGQLSSSIQYLSNNEKHIKFIFTDIKELNLTEETKIRNFFINQSFDYVINCAAYTEIDLAEYKKELNYKINAKAVQILAEESKKQNSTFIHISTDYIFDGNQNTPYFPESKTNPKNEYGKAKLIGEISALENNPKTIIIRTSWMYSPYRKNFVKTMKFLFENKEEISVVSDQYGIPTLAIDLAEAILTIINSSRKNYGIYHYSNSKSTNWYEFAIEIKNQLQTISFNSLKIKKINAVTTKDYPTIASRPMYSVLDLYKIQKDYFVKIYNWKESLSKIISRI